MAAVAYVKLTVWWFPHWTSNVFRRCSSGHLKVRQVREWAHGSSGWGWVFIREAVAELTRSKSVLKERSFDGNPYWCPSPPPHSSPSVCASSCISVSASLVQTARDVVASLGHVRPPKPQAMGEYPTFKYKRGTQKTSHLDVI